jgi:hypothetical protein
MLDAKKSGSFSGTAQAESPIPPLSTLEISGAICARVIHDLSNLMSGIIGNAEFAQCAGPQPENLQKTLRAIGLSANAAGKLLGQCLPLQRMVSAEAASIDAGEMARRITESAALAPGWRAEVAETLEGRICVQPRWLAAAVWQIARETQAVRGEVEIARGPAVFPVVWHGPKSQSNRPAELFQITLHYRSELILFSTDGPANPEHFGLLAVHELIRQFRGKIHARPKPPGRQEISILIPLL